MGCSESIKSGLPSDGVPKHGKGVFGESPEAGNVVQNENFPPGLPVSEKWKYQDRKGRMREIDSEIFIGEVEKEMDVQMGLCFQVADVKKPLVP